MAKIEKGRPLPGHTRLNYDECYAKLVLEKFFPEKYNNLKISDRPDLRDEMHDIGIEVTSAIPRQEQEVLHLACEIPFLPGKDQKRRIEYLNKKGYRYTKYGMTHPGHGYSWTGYEVPPVKKTSCADFLDAVSKKIDKLNSGNYESLSQYDLFVQSELLVENWMPPKILEWLISASDREKTYSIIYLLGLNGLFLFDIEADNWERFETNFKLYGLGEQARAMVEEGEKE